MNNRRDFIQCFVPSGWSLQVLLWKDKTKSRMKEWPWRLRDKYRLLFGRMTDLHRKTKRKLGKASFLCNSSLSFSQPWSNPEVGCTKMYLLTHYHRPWRCKCIYCPENGSFDLSIAAETREVRDMNWLPASSLLACPRSGMMRSVFGHICANLNNVSRVTTP